MTIHTMHLADEPFRMIRDGAKNIESRLYDEKRRQVELGDHIDFVGASGSVRVKVTALLRYPSFEMMFSEHSPHLFGGETPDALNEQIHRFYSKENEAEFGVLGIRFELV